MKLLILSLLCGSIALFTSTARAQVTVGDSDLISQLDYSDTWTENDTSRPDGAYPVSAAGIIVENDYGNPSESWSGGGGAFSINNDASVSSAGQYPGGSGAGSGTGFTQSGNVPFQFGIGYGLRTDFVLQSDFVMTAYTSLDIAIGSSAGTVGTADGLAVIFNPNGTVALDNVNVGETTTGLLSPVVVPNTAADTWANYAAEFNLNSDQITVYANEIDLGTINLATFDSGAYAAVIDSSTNAAVTIGALSTGGRLWTDNFEVGAAVPEPSTYALMLGGLVLLGFCVRRKLA